MEARKESDGEVAKTRAVTVGLDLCNSSKARRDLAEQLQQRSTSRTNPAAEAARQQQKQRTTKNVCVITPEVVAKAGAVGVK